MNQMIKNSNDYRQIKRANLCFLFCIIFEVAGIMTVLFWGSVGAQLAIYFLTMVFAVAITKKANLSIPMHPIKRKSEDDWKSNVLNLGLAIGTSICGIPIAMVLNAIANVLTNEGAQGAEDISQYSPWVSLFVFAIVPAIVEEYVFRGVILNSLLVLGTKAAILVSSLFFALLHFSLGSILYGFFFGCVFSFVRLSTDNLIMTIVMHMTFNGINVLLSYADLTKIPSWIFTMSVIIGVVGFLILFVGLIARNPVVIEPGLYKRRCAFTKEGVVSVIICMVIIVSLLLV